MRKLTEQTYLEAYDKYADAIYRHCFFRVFSKEKAEELAQDTFMKTWEYLADGKEVENLRAFLYRVANNLIIDYSRKKKEERLDSLLETSPDMEPAYDGRDNLESDELAREVLSKFKDLRESDRDILTMRFVDELDLREIAEALEITPNNVSVRLNRAVKALREQLDD
mgnify:CR=1 FL=1